MKNKDEIKVFIPPNRIIFLIVVLCGWPVVMLGVGAHYHPDAPTSPYINSLFFIWIVAFFSTLWLAIMTPAIVENGAYRRAAKISMAVYRCLAGFSTVILLGQVIKQSLST